MLTDGDHGIVCCTSAQGSRTRIQDTEWLSSRRRILSNVLSTICSLPHHFGVSFLPGSVCVVLDVVVPLHRCVLRRLKLHCRHHLLGCISLIITSIDQKDRVTSESKTRRQRTTARAGTYDNVFILACGIHSSGGMFVDKSVLIMQGSGWDITKILSNSEGSNQPKILLDQHLGRKLKGMTTETIKREDDVETTAKGYAQKNDGAWYCKDQRSTTYKSISEESNPGDSSSPPFRISAPPTAFRVRESPDGAVSNKIPQFAYLSHLPNPVSERSEAWLAQVPGDMSK